MLLRQRLIKHLSIAMEEQPLSHGIMYTEALHQKLTRILVACSTLKQAEKAERGII